MEQGSSVTDPPLTFDLKVRCFDSPLPTQALQEIKLLVARNTASGIQEEGLTMEGGCGTWHLHYSHKAVL